MILAIWQLSGLAATFMMLFLATRRVVDYEDHKDEWYVVIKAYKFKLVCY